MEVAICGNNSIEKALEIIAKAVVEIADALKESIEVLEDVFLEIVEMLKDRKGEATSVRYRIVKFLSKCSGISRHKLWVMTRRHKARDNC